MTINTKVALLWLAAGVISLSNATGVQGQDAKQSVNVFGEGKITVPAEFKRVEPKSRIIQHEFQAKAGEGDDVKTARVTICLLYTSPSPRDRTRSRMPSSA